MLFSYGLTVFVVLFSIVVMVFLVILSASKGYHVLGPFAIGLIFLIVARFMDLTTRVPDLLEIYNCVYKLSAYCTEINFRG